ncbi:DUF2213 domain-containing protein [Sporomusa aerivorans]|uniref:DUF2213 domain-containing protein n=1 Tax=Sporomusa aerivorans TaxID=204936 RepID=UPI00352AAD7F
MRAFYGTRFSPNMTQTPEGFVICHNVPIARTGWQDYFAREIGLQGEQPIKVYRSEEEVFSPATIASFEGKPVTDDHPAQDVRPDNIAAYGKGHAQNVHRGSGTQADILLADLVVTDPILLSEIETGKREVSCGYDCDYIPRSDGKGYDQVSIYGNHVAIVERGRAGPQISIRDSKPKTQGGKTKVKIDLNALKGKLLKAFATDAEPEELAAAHEMLGGQKEPAKDEEMHSEKTEENFNAQILAAIKALQADVAALKTGKAEPEAKDALTELEEEMTNGKPDETTTDETPEESVTIPVEEMKNEDGSKVMDAKTMDKASVLAAIKAIKPIIANLPPTERQKASDALTKELRAALQKPTPTQDAYADIMKRKKAADAAGEQGDFGKNCAKHNPHMKKEGK